MRVLLAGSIVVATASAAHAMGADVGFDLVAWNADGSAALLHRETSLHGDSSDGYEVIGITDEEAIGVTVSRTGWLDDAHPHGQQLDAADCTAALATLQHALDAHGFVGVSVRPSRCAADRRDDPIAVTPDVRAAADASHLALGAGNRRLWDTVDRLTGGVPLFATPQRDRDAATIEVASSSGKLAIALFTPSEGLPIRTQVFALVPDGDGFARLDVAM